MANANPIQAWDMRLIAQSEAAFLSVDLPVAASALQVITAKLGAASEQGRVTALKDRPMGRDMQSGWVEHDVDPFPWSLSYSQKSRAAIDTAAKDIAILKAAGMLQTINASTSVVLTVPNSPIEDGTFVSLQLARFLGSGTALSQAEYLNGCVTKNIKWSGGDKELTVDASGDGASKTHLGRIDSLTMTNVDTDLTVSASEVSRFGIRTHGYMQIENEVIDIRALNYSATTINSINRGLASTSAASHTAKPLYPYLPVLTAYTGGPISEADCTITIDGITVRCIGFTVDWTTGLDLLPAETSSKYRQGAKAVRSNLTLDTKMILTTDRVDFQGYVTNRANKTVSVTITQRTGTAGGSWSITVPYCELEQFEVPDTENDVAIIDLKMRCRGNGTGNNMFSITLT